MIANFNLFIFNFMLFDERAYELID